MIARYAEELKLLTIKAIFSYLSIAYNILQSFRIYQGQKKNSIYVILDTRYSLR